MTSIKHSIRYFGVNASDERVACTKGMKASDWSWVATCTPCGWDSETPVAHAEIVAAVAAHKAGAPAPAAAAPVYCGKCGNTERWSTGLSECPKCVLVRLTPKGREFMALVGDWSGSFFDNGIVAGSGAWGEVLASEGCVTASPRGMGGVLAGLNKHGLWDVVPAEAGDVSDFWYLTELGAAVALLAAGK